jgi:bifunctional non-homologous end joining protein LigD
MNGARALVMPSCVRVWVFDMLSQFGRDLRSLSLIARRVKLDNLMNRVKCPLIRYSETFSEPLTLLAACDLRGLEGIVSKRVGAPYRSGPSNDCIKIKCATWREANKNRGELFNKEKRR